MARTLSGCVILFLLVLPAARAAEAPTWKAGAARVVITPDKPMWMSGYSGRNRPAEDKVHDLWAKALALEDPGGRRGVLISFDLIGIHRNQSVPLREELKKKYGLEAGQVILAFSHTHTGPQVGDNLRPMHKLDAEQSRRIDDYAQALHGKVVALVGEALANLAPARVEWDNGLATFAVNRRSNTEANVPALRQAGQLKGPFDHEVPVLAVRDPAGKIRAVVFGYACHATVLNFFQWTGDYPGFAQLALEKAHPGATAMFFAGCGGDQNPLPRRSVALAQHYGDTLAAAVDAILARPMKPVQGTLAQAYREVEAPLAALPTREQILKDAQDKNPYVVNRAKLLLAQIEKNGSLRGTYPYPVQVWRLGGLTWVTLGGEVVVDYSLRLKKELGPGRTWVTGYANDVMAYVPSLRVLTEGGYEGGGAMVFYGLPTVWGPRIEETIMTAVHEEAEKAGLTRSARK
jgi:hypothetical protein